MGQARPEHHMAHIAADTHPVVDNHPVANTHLADRIDQADWDPVPDLDSNSLLCSSFLANLHDLGVVGLMK
jgi:hypothetical protein